MQATRKVPSCCFDTLILWYFKDGGGSYLRCRRDTIGCYKRCVHRAWGGNQQLERERQRGTETETERERHTRAHTNTHIFKKLNKQNLIISPLHITANKKSRPNYYLNFFIVHSPKIPIPCRYWALAKVAVIMEPVPELHSLEEFRASPVPRLRLQESALYDSQTPIKNRDQSGRPPTLRRTTEPIPQSPRSPVWSSPVTPSIPFRPRNTSPYARGHFRSRSNGSALAPPISRAQSLPGVNGAGHLLMSPQRPASPLASPARVRIPRKPADEVFPGFPNRTLIDISEGGQALIEEDASKVSDRSASPILGIPSTGSYTRVRRPGSPLRHLAPASPTTSGTTPTTPSPSTSSPSPYTAKFSESYLTSNSSTSSLYYPGSYASSSVPSTPTSTRSRSPSISSLETIPDTPDAEEAALEAERIAQLKAAADAADGVESEDAKSRGLDGSGGRGRVLGGFGSRDKRKRWSVCGAERRGDLNLDTIWED
ncbi:hypothetical protein EYC80_001131 [Monilinia laxa]|uniref:Basic proline-rich protein n=1 Tax=Monilinia laxa TaxID=61186 RepID=A0A5N6K8E4_MONLA|nr:hypothetical protein EYC80_001131 [Monilinia laxa]